MGRDFLSHNQLGITWGLEGILQLRDKQDLLVQTAEGTTNPIVKLAKKNCNTLQKFGFGRSFNNITLM